MRNLSDVIVAMVLFLAMPCFAQQGELNTVPVLSGLPRFPAAEVVDSLYLNLPSLRRTVYPIHIRIALTGVKVDLFCTDRGKYGGIVTRYTSEYRRVRNKRENYDSQDEASVVSFQLEIDPAIARKLATQIMGSGQPLLGADSMIPGWHMLFLHCRYVNFEFSLNGIYSSQQYHCPWGQNDSLAARGIILSNYDSIRNLLRIDTISKQFSSRLPKGRTYSDDGYTYSYHLTETQLEGWRQAKPMQDYLRAHRDTITSRIEARISEQRELLSTLEHYARYFLNFDHDGKLNEITNAERSRWVQYFSYDARQDRHSRRMIRRVFSGFELKDLGLKYPFSRTLYLSSEFDTWLGDDTMYGSD